MFTRRSFAPLVVTALAAVAILRGCDCGSDTLGNNFGWDCTEQGGKPGPDDKACDPSQRFVQGECTKMRCDPENNCCPGTLCTGGGSCEVPLSRFVDCTGDGACEDGQRCLPKPWDPSGNMCRYPPTDLTDQCPDGGVPFNHRCVVGGDTPCQGGCPAGTVCNIDEITYVDDNGSPVVKGGRCETPPATLPAGTGCDQICGSAQILVYDDPDNMIFDRCCEVSCRCAIIPPIEPGNWGRFSDLAVGTDGVYVSGYDGTYGDLVLGVHGRISGQLQTLQYVDGVPTGAPVVADPNGPRGGQAAPGPDVGRYTSIALLNGDPRIAYYDADNGDLKYAAYDRVLAAWTVGLIDDGRDSTGVDTGDVGRYTSLLIDSNGIAHVTYYAHRRTANNRVVTGPMYARARDTSPLIYDDWERVGVDDVASCDDTCTASQVCVMESAPTCRATRTGCSACACDQTCVDIGGAPVCRRTLPKALVEPCAGNCDLSGGEVCVSTGGAGSECRSELQTCSGCANDESCVDVGGTPTCRLATPYSRIAGLPEGVGLFTSLILYNGAAHLTYYDRLNGLLRGAVANFSFDATSVGTFTSLPIACAASDDVGQNGSLARSADGLALAVAFQALGGDALYFKSGADLVTGLGADPTNLGELVDDGIRTSQLDAVGGSASLIFDPSAAQAEPFIAYADLTDNDLLLAYRRNNAWTHTTLLSAGAYGSFARVAIDSGFAYVSNYLLLRDSLNRDRSRLVVHIVDLSALP